jgi:hypothetical protein
MAQPITKLEWGGAQ